MNSQTERTRLAWRRTILALLVVGGIGAVHLATAGLVELAVLTGLVTVAGCVAAMRRLTVLRVSGTPLPAWEPAVLTVSSCLLALSVIFAG
ncbi:MAG TPA: hypothetical protein P5544_07660 [Candidatus Nanopelagicales bacterium]|nr:hypothetical protein [Candidatus Nanopelagicales bacterium]